MCQKVDTEEVDAEEQLQLLEARTEAAESFLKLGESRKQC